VQVFGDSHGNVVHLFERDCSLQRRHQKVIEEAPAPGMDSDTREAVCGAAVRAAKAVNYENAGTIEFIADASEGLRADRIWFMEMNTRLQVEHPVTEEITGQDLVEWQLRVASGEPLPTTQDELSITGHAIEARLYAEDPRNGFLPSVGRLEEFFEPAPAPGIFEPRLDVGYESGDLITPFYDPMIGKIICHDEDRQNAAEALRSVCLLTTVWPNKNNLGLVARCLADPDFLSGDIDTSFIEKRLEKLAAPDLPLQKMAETAAFDLLDVVVRPSEPWQILGFRLNSPAHSFGRVIDGSKRVYDVNLDESGREVFGGRSAPDEVVAAYEGERITFWRYEPRGTGTTHGLHDGEIEAPMPGKVTAVEVAAGEKVEKGQRLLTLEAMKMEHALTAPFDGTVAELNATVGAQVTEGQMLVMVEPSSSPAEA
jgi:3-methylcrotonyl-CoA carboxylase alpha subunit